MSHHPHFIRCKQPIAPNGQVNEAVNLAQVITICKNAYGTIKSIDQYAAIDFSTVKNRITWMYDSKEDRDRAFDRLMMSIEAY